MVLLAAAVIIGMRPVLTYRCTSNVTPKIPLGPISHHIGHYDSQVSEPYMSLGSSERLISGPCLRQASGLLRMFCGRWLSTVIIMLHRFIRGTKGCNPYNQNQRPINNRESGRYGLELLLLIIHSLSYILYLAQLWATSANRNPVIVVQNPTEN